MKEGTDRRWYDTEYAGEIQEGSNSGYELVFHLAQVCTFRIGRQILQIRVVYYESIK